MHFKQITDDSIALNPFWAAGNWI